MDDRTDPKKIADEAIGQRPESAIPQVVKEGEANVTHLDIRQRAKSAGPDASVATKTAEAMGEHEEGAYAHRHAMPEQVHRQSMATVSRTDWSATRVTDLSVIGTAVTAFAVGYAAALLIHRH